MKPVENSNDLKNLAPTLSSIEKKASFSVPDNYFDTLPTEIMDKITSDPLLNPAAKANPFALPENYFNELPLDISNRIEKAKASKSNPAGLFKAVLRPQYAVSLITACFALFVCIRFFEKPVTVNISQPTAENISISESDLLNGMDESTLLNEISDESIALLNPDTKNVADKEMEDYIINNNIDISDFVKEL